MRPNPTPQIDCEGNWFPFAYTPCPACLAWDDAELAARCARHAAPRQPRKRIAALRLAVTKIFFPRLMPAGLDPGRCTCGHSFLIRFRAAPPHLTVPQFMAPRHTAGRGLTHGPCRRSGNYDDADHARNGQVTHQSRNWVQSRAAKDGGALTRGAALPFCTTVVGL